LAVFILGTRLTGPPIAALIEHRNCCIHEELAMPITHKEVRRHPLWREELETPLQTPQVPASPNVRLLVLVGVLIATTAVGAILLYS
jgi:hypothetical protein